MVGKNLSYKHPFHYGWNEMRWNVGGMNDKMVAAAK